MTTDPISRRLFAQSVAAIAAFFAIPAAAKEVDAFTLRFGDRYPAWFGDAMRARVVKPLPSDPGSLNWGRYGALVTTKPGFMEHARLGDEIIRNGDGSLSVRSAA